MSHGPGWSSRIIPQECLPDKQLSSLRSYSRSDEVVELVSFRLGALLPQHIDEGLREAPVSLALPGQVRCFVDGRWRDCARVDR